MPLTPFLEGAVFGPDEIAVTVGDFQLSDRQQLKGYFLDGRFRWVSAIPTMWNACAGRLSERFGWHEASTTSGRLIH
jgi:hypothetical protein